MYILLSTTVNSLYNELPHNDNLSITIIFHVHRKFVWEIFYITISLRMHDIVSNWMTNIYKYRYKYSGPTISLQ